MAAAHAAGKAVVAHAVAAEAYTMALDVGADILTHLPLGAPLTYGEAARMAEGGRTVIPTLVMMEGIMSALGAPEAVAAVLPGIAELHRAGVPVLVGTDANTQPGAPFNAEHGASLHREPELLVEAGLTHAEASVRQRAKPPASSACPIAALSVPGSARTSC